MTKEIMNQLLYIDPASTAIIWQVLAGIFITFGVVLSIWWTKISTFVKKLWVKMFGGKKKNAADGAAVVEEIDEELADEEPEATTTDAPPTETPDQKGK